MQVQPCSLRVLLVVVCTALSTSASAQTAAQARSSVNEPAGTASVDRQLPPAVTPPLGYVIGADDVLSIRFWSDEQLSAEVVVRPDGKISVPLLNDVQATGLTPEQLLAARRGESDDPKTASALAFARAVVANRGKVSNGEVEAVRAAGYSDGEVAELVGHVALNTFTNYLNNVAATEIDFPKAPALDHHEVCATIPGCDPTR